MIFTFDGTFTASITKREVSNAKPSAKEVLAMDGAVKNLQQKLKNAKSDLEEVAEKMERNIQSIVEMSEYITANEQDEIKNALVQANNVDDRMKKLRTDLAQLAKTTVSQTTRIITKMQDISSGKSTFDDRGRSLFRSMRALLVTSERRLTEAEVEIEKLTNEINQVSAGLLIFQAMVKGAINKESQLSSTQIKDDVLSNINSLVGNGLKIGAAWAAPAKKKSQTEKILATVQGLIPAVTKITNTIFDAVNRQDVLPKLEATLEDVTRVVGIVEKQSDDIQIDRQIVTKWKGIVQDIRDEWDVAGEQDFIDEIESVMDSESDIMEVIEGYVNLKTVAQEYIDHIKTVCDICL